MIQQGTFNMVQICDHQLKMNPLHFLYLPKVLCQTGSSINNFKPMPLLSKLLIYSQLIWLTCCWESEVLKWDILSSSLPNTYTTKTYTLMHPLIYERKYFSYSKANPFTNVLDPILFLGILRYTFHYSYSFFNFINWILYNVISTTPSVLKHYSPWESHFLETNTFIIISDFLLSSQYISVGHPTSVAVLKIILTRSLMPIM